MFTGIVETIGTIAKIETKGTNKTFFLESVLAEKCRPEQSILHDGVWNKLKFIDLLSIEIDPELGLSINESKFNKVDFPDPDGPINE